MESFISRFKTEDKPLLIDAQNLHDLLSERMGYRNEERQHSTIGTEHPRLMSRLEAMIVAPQFMMP